MLDHGEYDAALAALDWQVELGADEAILDTPVDRYEAAAQAARTPVAAPPQEPMQPPRHDEPDRVAAARAAAMAAGDLDGLKAALTAFEGCDLKRGARNLVFSDGAPAARVMIVGEAPEREEDISGKPFAGAAGKLLDRMFAAIGLSRAEGGLYLTTALPWRLPQNRVASEDEIAMLRPFLERHVALADPEIVVLMGNTPAQVLLGRNGILRLRGQWMQVGERPALPMAHPNHLLRNPEAKREAWADLLSLRSRLDGTGG